MIIKPVRIIPPPLGERHAGPTGTKHRKGQDEQRGERGAVKRARDEVRVVLEDARAVVAQVELHEEAGDDLAQQDAGLGGVVRDVARVLNELWQVDVVKGEAADFGNKLWRGVLVSDGG